jgi:hypothetical protein
MTLWTESESVSQSASLSWNKARIWGLQPDSFTLRQLRDCWCGALSLTKGRGCRLQLLLVLARAVILVSESRGTRDHILLSQIWDFYFSRLLRIAGLRWRYSTPPPHGVLYELKNELSFITLRRTEERSLPRTVRLLLFVSSVATKRVLISGKRFYFCQRIRC